MCLSMLKCAQSCKSVLNKIGVVNHDSLSRIMVGRVDCAHHASLCVTMHKRDSSCEIVVSRDDSPSMVLTPSVSCVFVRVRACNRTGYRLAATNRYDFFQPSR